LRFCIFQYTAKKSRKRDNIIRAGLLSGFISRIAGVDGKVVLICIFNLVRAVIVRRASLVMYLFLSLITSLFYYLFFDLMSEPIDWCVVNSGVPATIKCSCWGFNFLHIS